MATYKAEFLAHYYAGRLRPRAAYAMGLIPWWAPLGSSVAPLANLLGSAPLVSGLLKALGGSRPAARSRPSLRNRSGRGGAAARLRLAKPVRRG
jgi:hypothetical protein